MTAIPPKKQSRTRLFLLVIGLLGLILTSIFLNRRSLHELQQASASLYRDRLVVSDMLVKLTSTVYRKRLVLEDHVTKADQSEPQLVPATLNRLNYGVDSLLTEFGRTKLTRDESAQLQQLKQRLRAYNELEIQLSRNPVASADSQRILLSGPGSIMFEEVIQTLEELSSLQLTVGETLMIGSRGQTNYSYVITALQIGLVLLTGISLYRYRL